MIATHQHSTICTCGTIATNRSLQFDPTRTTVLRNAFVADMKRRFNWLNRLIVQAIVDQDVFGLAQPSVTAFGKKIPLPTGSLPGYKEFQFMRSSEKVTAFMSWLETQQAKGILQVSRMPQVGLSTEQAWTDLYIEDSYKRGVIRARYEMGKAGSPVPTLDATGGIGASMSTPFHMDRVGLLYSRTFQELKGITAAMDSQLSRVLAQGIVDGDGPRLLARKLVKTITGPMGDLGMTDTLGRFIPARRRAMTMARTEIIRAHHGAMVQEYRNYGLEGVKVKAEWATAGDARVCERCAAMEGRVFTLDEISGMIPLHPNCRCIALPMDVGTTARRTVDIPSTEDLEMPVVFTQDGKEFSKNLIKQKWGGQQLPSTIQATYAKDLKNQKRFLDILNDGERVSLGEQNISLQQLKSFQHIVRTDDVAKIAKDWNLEKYAEKGLPKVYRFPDGSMVLSNGNHRINAAMLRKVEKLPVKLFDLIPEII